VLTLKIRHQVGSVLLHVEFALTQPWTLLFGPSGSGKTTVLRAIAGFVRPDEGWISQGKNVLVDSSQGIFLPAYRRAVRSGSQAPWLFPHMTTQQNVLYGSGWSWKPEDEAQLAEEVLALFRLRQLSSRFPRDLSGGEKQRASVARAVFSAVTFDAHGCGLLLLDEPFSGLDAALRDELLASLREWLVRWEVPVLSVTHDVGEAFQLGAEVIKIADGKVVDQGQVHDVLAEERRLLMDQLARGASEV